jgi:hypothetical protein
MPRHKRRMAPAEHPSTRQFDLAQPAFVSLLASPFSASVWLLELPA